MELPMSCLPSDSELRRHLCVQVRNTEKPLVNAQTRQVFSRLVLATMLLPLTVGAAAQSGPPLTFASPVAVGTPSTEAAVSVTFQAAGEVTKVKVLTLGAEGQDFAAGTGSSCLNKERVAGQTCQQSVIFTPAAP